MDRTFSGKIVVVTGATSGIGAVMARELAELGAVSVLTGRSEDKLREAAATVKGMHDRFALDVTSADQVKDTVDRIAGRYGRIDIWINNAGYGVFEPFLDASLESFGEMMDVNYMGTVRYVKAVLPHMLAAGGGHIVNIASMAGKIGSAKASGYSATKHAVLGFTNSLRQELLGSGIKLTAVNPGPIDTPFFDRADPSGAYADNVRWFMLKPERISRAVMGAIRSGRAEVNLPLAASAGAKLMQLFPQLLAPIAARILNKK